METIKKLSLIFEMFIYLLKVGAKLSRQGFICEQSEYTKGGIFFQFVIVVVNPIIKLDYIRKHVILTMSKISRKNVWFKEKKIVDHTNF